MSVVTGSPVAWLHRIEHLQPLVQPGAAEGLPDVRFALSNDALNTKWRPSESAIRLSVAATPRQWSRLSITHGPQIQSN